MPVFVLIPFSVNMKPMKHETHLSYLFLLLISCCFFVSHSLNSSTTSLQPFPCLPSQTSALLQLKQESAFSHANILENWNHTRDCCFWDGVTCDAKNGEVVGLDLSSSGINGPLSPNSSLFDLRHLQRLNLASNNFSLSTVPSRFGHLTRLTHLNLSYSLFSGELPPEIARLTELVSLDLSSYYDFDHSMVVDMTRLVQNLTKLRVLHLDQVTIFSSSVHKSTVNLSSLTSLSLNGCSLHGEFPHYIFNLPKIEEIYMSDDYSNHTDLGFLPEFQSGSNLKYLVLSSVQYLSGKLPISIGNLKSLILLNLEACSLSGTIPSSLGNLTRLEKLDLSGNSFSGQIPTSLGHLTSLKHLSLSGNGFNGEIPSFLGNLMRLEELDLSYNSFSGQVPMSIGHLTSLKQLDLSGNSFSGQFPTSLGHLPSLKQLWLSWNRYKGEIPSSLGNLRQLEDLDLSYNSFSGQIPLSLGNLLQLRSLDLSANSFSSPIPSTLGNLRQLVYLQLHDNAFTGKFPLSLVNLTLLQELNLSSNQFTELSDPSNALEKLNISSLDLSNNSITGAVPSSLFRVPTLRHLKLNLNQLTSIDNHNISSSLLSSLDLSFNNLSIEFSIFSDLCCLEELYLSHNNVSLPNKGASFTFPKFYELDLSSSNIRQFPDFLKTQDELSFLDLSNNKIEGKLPKWFWTIRNDSTSMLYSAFDLSLSNNFISGWEEAVSSIIPTWKTWDMLDLSANNLTGRVDPILCKIGLVFLDLSKNHLNGSIPQCFSESSELEVLSLHDNNLDGNLSHIMFTEHGCGSFLVLDLSHNRLQGRVPQSWIKCQNLELLNLGYNQISDVFPFWLQNWPNLKVLMLGSNKFQGPIWSSDRPLSFAMLQILDLSFNHFSGALPSGFFKNWTSMMEDSKDKNQFENVVEFSGPLTLINKGNKLTYAVILPSLVSIDLSNNRFHGEIPKSIGNLRSLVVLNLSSNNFGGLIPSSMGQLTELESLDLSKNELSGRIPQELTNLTFLECLDLSQNQLTGPIPQERQFSTFLNSSFDGNLGLCGPPLSKKCGDDATPTSNRDHGSESDNFDFSWRPVAMGYGCGVLIGVITGYVVISRRPYWLARTFGGFILW